MGMDMDMDTGIGTPPPTPSSSPVRTGLRCLNKPDNFSCSLSYIITLLCHGALSASAVLD